MTSYNTKDKYLKEFEKPCKQIAKNLKNDLSLKKRFGDRKYKNKYIIDIYINNIVNLCKSKADLQSCLKQKEYLKNQKTACKNNKECLEDLKFWVYSITVGYLDSVRREVKEDQYIVDNFDKITEKELKNS